MYACQNTETTPQVARPVWPVAPRRHLRQLLSQCSSVVGMAAFVLAWHLLSLRYPTFILPSPQLVFERMITLALDGTLATCTLETLREALAGLLLGGMVAGIFGFWIAHSRFADRLLSPMIVATQGIPFVAIAPLLFIWFGNGLLPRMLMAGLIVFFPLAVNVVEGFRAVPPSLRDVFRAMSVTRLELLTKLELPAALPFLFAGLRVSVTLSVVGAITAEFFSAGRGLGYLVRLGSGLYDTPLVMAGVVAIIALALGLYASVRLVERLMLIR